MKQRARYQTESRLSRTNATIVKQIHSERIRNEQIGQMVGRAPVLNKRESSELRWLGRLERMPEGKANKKRWKWWLEGTRPRGKPRRR